MISDFFISDEQNGRNRDKHEDTFYKRNSTKVTITPAILIIFTRKKLCTLPKCGRMICAQTRYENLLSFFRKKFPKNVPKKNYSLDWYIPSPPTTTAISADRWRISRRLGWKWRRVRASEPNVIRRAYPYGQISDVPTKRDRDTRCRHNGYYLKDRNRLKEDSESGGRGRQCRGSNFPLHRRFYPLVI